MKNLFTFLIIIAFVGIIKTNAQTQMPNAGFESWSTLLPNYRPANYYTIDTMGMHSCYKTTDKHGGTYAAMLRSLDTTIIFFPIKLPGLATLGRINVSTQAIYGGIPFTDKPDNFRCYYKYLPTNIDTMMVAVYFWKYDNVLHKKDTLGGFVFDTSATISSYTYLDIPIPWDSNFTIAPDSMNIILFSSLTVQNHSSAFFDDFSFYYVSVGLETKLDNILNEVYPNPTNGIININNDKATEVNIFNITGGLVLNQKFSENYAQIDLSDFPKGMYFIQQISEKGVITKRIIFE